MLYNLSPRKPQYLHTKALWCHAITHYYYAVSPQKAFNHSMKFHFLSQLNRTYKKLQKKNETLILLKTKLQLFETRRFSLR